MAVQPQERKAADPAGKTPSAPPPQTPARPPGPSRRQPSAPATPTASATLERKTDGTNAKISVAAVIGLLIAIAFLGLMFAMKPVVPRMAGIFIDRGWVNWTETYFFFWALVILAMKFQLLRRQRECLTFDVLPQQLAPTITPETVDGFRNHVSSLPCKPGESFLVERVARTLDHFRSRVNVEEATSIATAQSDQDAQAAQTSYTLLNFFTWAIPILGFIGTVKGIGDAVGSFAATIESGDSIEGMKNALKDVTSGLGTAFDTTLLALCLALIVVMVQRFLEKGEGDMLIATDDYCNENLISRLDDGGGGPAGSRTADQPSDWVRAAVKEAMAGQEAEFKVWTAKLAAAGDMVTQKVMAGWETVHAKLQDSQQGQFDEIKGLVDHIGSDRKEFAAEMKEAQESQTRQLSEAVTKMADTASTIQGDITSLQQKQVDGFQDIVTHLKSDLTALQEAATQKTKADAEQLQSMAASFSQSLAKLQEQASASQERLSEHLEAASKAVTDKVAGAWAEIDEKLKATHSAQIGDVQKVIAEITSERQSFVEQVKQTQSAQVSEFATVVKAMEETAMRIQSEVAQLQEKQTEGLEQSVTRIKGDLETIQKQTGALQLESSKHFEQITQQVTAKVVEGWEQINKNLGDTHRNQVGEVQKLLDAVANDRKGFTEEAQKVQEAQVKQFSETISTMERTAGRIQEQMTAMQEQFMRTFGESATKQAQEIKNIQGEIHEKARADGDSIKQMVTGFVETMNSLREQAKSSQKEMADNVRNAVPAMREQLTEMAREFANTLNQLREGQGRSAQETANVLREAAREIQRELSTSQQAPMEKLNEVSSAIANQARQVQSDMTSASSALTDAARQIAESSKQSQEGAIRAANEQLQKITQVGQEMVRSVTESQQKIAEQMAAQSQMAQSTADLAKTQEMLANNMKLMATSDDFKKALAGIDHGLDALNPILQALSEKTGVGVTPAPDGRKKGALSRLFGG
mgnify:CR=1 FL=1